MNKRKTIISFILTFIILIIGMIGFRVLRKAKKTSIVETIEKEKFRMVNIKALNSVTAKNLVAVDGRISAYERVNLTANVSGILQPTSKVTKKGMYFKKGTLLFKIDQRKAVYNLHAMRSSLLNAITMLMPELKLDYPEAYINWKKYLDDFEVEQAINSLPAFTNEQEKYFVANRNIYNLYYNIKSAETQLKDYNIYAPFSGVITQADAFPGTMVMPGQPLAFMINTSHFELEAPVFEKDLLQIKKGNAVFLNSTNSDKSWVGQVSRIGEQIDPTTQRIPVYIKIKGADLKEGMYLKGQIEGAALKNVISIPKDLIVNQEYIYTVKDSILQLQKLKIKNRDEKFIHADTLSGENWILINNPLGFFEGEKVAPVVKED